MELSAAEARSALEDIERTTTLSARSTGYRRASPYLILWGVIWVLGYAEPLLAPRLSEGLTWLALDLIGMIGSVVISARTQASRSTAPKIASRTRRILAASGLLVVFIIGALTVMHPTDSAQIRVFPSLVLGLVYGLVGIFGMPRFLWIAVVVPAAGLAAYYLAPTALPLTLSLIGGGSLVVSGLWMRRL